MSRKTTARALAALVGVVGVLGLQMVSVGAAADEESTCGYAAEIVTATDLTLDRSSISPGQTTTARVTVTSGVGVPPGDVSFQVTGRAASAAALTAGAAAYAIPADLAVGSYTVTATYVPPVCWLPSSDSASLQVVAPGVAPPSPETTPPTVAPEEQEAEEPEILGVGGGAPPAPPARPAPIAGFLPSTGADATLTWFGLAGLGLLGAGGATLLTRRLRRGTS